MKTRKSRSWRPVYVAFSAFSSCYLLLFLLSYEYKVPAQSIVPYVTGDPSLQAQPRPTRYNSLNLTTEQCAILFPDLTRDIRDTVALGPFVIRPAESNGPLQVRIKDGQLFIFDSKRTYALSPELLDAQTAALHQLQRAVITSPTTLPDTIITINVNDQPFGSAFSYTRPAFRYPGSHGPPITRAFLMPHFSFWAWPLPFTGSISRAAAAIDIIESQVPFLKKDGRVAWRGTMGWNSAHYPGLRENLLRVTGQADWADVQALRGYEQDKAGSSKTSAKTNSTSNNALMIEDFCRYKYVLYTEGITYSGRLQFLQMCQSVLLSPPIAWLQHSTHLIKPMFTSDLLVASGLRTWAPSEDATSAWPKKYPPEEANAVFVSPDWSDLERTVLWLEQNPDVAEGIAKRQRELFVDKGYLSPAAEVCYWRELIRSWNQVVLYENDAWDDQKMASWELFSLRHKGEKI